MNTIAQTQKWKLYFLASILLLSGCGQNERERALQGYINQLKAASSQKEVKIKPAVWQLPTPVTYKPDGYSNSDSRTHTKDITNPLQAYPIRNLQFVGVLTQGSQTSAYVMTPDSMIYLVKVGDIIGEEYGKIVKINSDRIEVAETAMKGNHSSEQMIVMQLKDSPE